jgi:hypothetical protein
MNVPSSGGGGAHVIEDEGTPVAQRTNMNFTGAGVTVTDAGGKTVVTIPGGAGGSVTQAVVSLPYPAQRMHRVVVTDAAVGPTSKIIVVLAGVSDTQANAGDAVDLLSLQAFPGTGNFELQANFLVPHAGPLTINYMIG